MIIIPPLFIVHYLSLMTAAAAAAAVRTESVDFLFSTATQMEPHLNDTSGTLTVSKNYQ